MLDHVESGQNLDLLYPAQSWEIHIIAMENVYSQFFACEVSQASGRFATIRLPSRFLSAFYKVTRTAAYIKQDATLGHELFYPSHSPLLFPNFFIYIRL